MLVQPRKLLFLLTLSAITLTIATSLSTSAKVQTNVNVAQCPSTALDCTEYLWQALVQDGACVSDVVIGPRDGGVPWNVAPIFLNCSHQHIKLLPDVIIEAKRGEFHMKNACLLTMDSLTNVTLEGEGATLRMWREDYANSSMYNHSEWRHAVTLRGVNSVTIANVMIVESGGDGIYIANSFHAGSPDCRNVIINNVQSLRHYRQGMSVIGVVGLTVTNTIFGWTNGTAPMAGVDFEPNAATNHLSQIRFNNVTVVGNTGRGFQLSLYAMNRSSTPIDIEIRNSVVQSSGSFGLSISGCSSGSPINSHVLFSNVVVANTNGSGLLVENKGVALALTLENVTISYVAKNANSPMWIEGRSPGAATGMVSLSNVVVFDEFPRACVTFLGNVSQVTGNVVEHNTAACVKTTVPIGNSVLISCKQQQQHNGRVHMYDENTPRQGFVGVYHSATGNVADGHNISAWGVGAWGVVAQENSPGDGGTSFKDNLDFECNVAHVNSIYGMLIAASEGGTFSNPNDTDLFKPLPETSRGGVPGPHGSTGLLQGAARWSKLSQTYCSQISGVVIDDFWSNYDDVPPPPPPPPGVPCPKCPSSQPYMYGDASAGYFCCHWPATSRCSPPTGVPPQASCCLEPGAEKGCQSSKPCGNNPTNSTPCGGGTGKLLSLFELKQIKGALMGHTFNSDGTVDFTSPVLTPWMKLFVVTYDEQITRYDNQPLFEEGVIDGASFWISGPSQQSMHSNLGKLVASLRAKVGPTYPILTGGYITYSSIGWMTPEPFYDLLNQSIKLYDDNAIQGFYIFAGDVLKSMNTSLWKQWDLPQKLAESYQPHLGTLQVSVVDASTKAPLSVEAVATVFYKETSYVTRRTIAPHSVLSFDGWAGQYSIVVTALGYQNTTATITMQSQMNLPLQIEMVKLSSSAPQRQILLWTTNDLAYTNETVRMEYFSRLEALKGIVSIVSPCSYYLSPNTTNNEWLVRKTGAELVHAGLKQRGFSVQPLVGDVSNGWHIDWYRNTFISEAFAAKVKAEINSQQLDGLNFDYEPKDGGALNDTHAYATMITNLANQNPSASITVDMPTMMSEGNQTREMSLMCAVGAGCLDMSTYGGDHQQFLQHLKADFSVAAPNAITRYSLGLCPSCQTNHTTEEISLRVNAAVDAGLTGSRAIAIWANDQGWPNQDAWMSSLKAFAQV